MAEAFDLVAESRAAPMVWSTLKIVFGIVPIVAGLDKFTNLLVQWEKYIAPIFASLLLFSGRTLMYIAGVIEIIAGVGVLRDAPDAGVRGDRGNLAPWHLGRFDRWAFLRHRRARHRHGNLGVLPSPSVGRRAVARDSAQPADKTALMSGSAIAQR